MKNLLVLFALCIIFVFVFEACRKPNCISLSNDKEIFKDQINSTLSRDQKEWIIEILEKDFYISDRNQKSKMKNLGATIDSAEAGIITREYYSDFSDDALKKTAKSVYFDQAGLNNFINSIPTELCLNDGKAGVLGFRF